MESNASASRYILVALCVILVITAFVLIGLNAFDLESKLGVKILPVGPSQAQLDEQYKLGYLAARTKLSPGCPFVNRDTNSMSGVVESISGNTLTIRQTSFDTDEIVDGVSDMRKVTLSGNTKVELLTSKSQDEFSRELEAFNPDPNNPTTPPTPFNVAPLKTSNIKVGDNVVVTSDKEIRLLESFSATAIQINR